VLEKLLVYVAEGLDRHGAFEAICRRSCVGLFLLRRGESIEWHVSFYTAWTAPVLHLLTGKGAMAG
jgi:hypothetical protein